MRHLESRAVSAETTCGWSAAHALNETGSSSRTAVLNTCFPMHLFTLYMLSCMCHEPNQLSLVEMIQFSSDTAGVTKSTTVALLG